MMMRLAIGLTVLFSLPIALIQAQPGEERLLLTDGTTLGEIWLALDAPSRMTASTNGGRSPRVAYVLEYPDRSLHVWVEFQVCEIDQSGLWRIPSQPSFNGIFFVSRGAPDYIRVMPSHPVKLDPRFWAKQLRDLCQK